MKNPTKRSIEKILREVATGKTLGIRMADGLLPFEDGVNKVILKLASRVNNDKPSKDEIESLVRSSLKELESYLR